jgi:hypothetical protein
VWWYAKGEAYAKKWQCAGRGGEGEVFCVVVVVVDRALTSLDAKVVSPLLPDLGKMRGALRRKKRRRFSVRRLTKAVPVRV